ncbi:RhtB (resistance to homoserine/threonine) family protein [Bacillus sp. SORGH_AS 510]|uniref:LysE family translocator n=1 Tax=Bacillus sp. SORGH_AS_0510 TaxID=3041771 RepID=UPI0027860AF2|nr:LysE family translocator [Bacillus sp. SORGH_AS_0510]MDQ1143886.1 RhtB (resistance to homoserine/threonine) family protein [Bacillus sp. SORGH_AS_0510]
MINFYAFVMLCVFLIILPGPDTAIVTSNTISDGKIGGFKTALGTCCALCIHTTAAVLGLSAVIMKSALVFSIFKYIGAVYLLYLGVKALWSLKKKNETGENVEVETKKQLKSTSCFKQGFLTDILNPKVAILFLTFFPQFVNSESSTFLPFIIMGVTYTVLTAVWFLLYVALINRISAFMKRPKTKKVIEGITGTILIGFGVKLALEKVHN